MTQFDDSFSQAAAVQFRRILEWAQTAVGESFDDKDMIYAQVMMEDYGDMLASPGLRAFVATHADGLVGAVRAALAEQDMLATMSKQKARQTRDTRWPP